MSKLQIKVSPKVLNDTYVSEVMQAAGSKGEWFDLCAAQDYTVCGPNMAGQTGGVMSEIFHYPITVSLGIAMELPDGYEAIVAPRSSLFNKTGLILVNSIGVIDSTYRGNEDIWKATFLPTRDSFIELGQRICQFRIQPSQKASPEIKKQWLEYDGIEFITVDNLDNDNRDGFGSTD